MTEAQFQARIVQAAKLLGWRCYHTFDSRRSAAGFPDLVLIRDRIVYLEVKTETGRISPGQAEWIAAINAAGGTALVVRPSMWNEIVASLKRRTDRAEFADASQFPRPTMEEIGKSKKVEAA